jgi:phosphoribosylanthranilate isomerase
MVEVKFCGMRREEDVRMAAQLGAAYVGVVLTTSPRKLTPEEAASLLSVLDGSGVRRVGVFGGEPVDFIVRAAALASLDVVQLVGERDAADFRVIQASGVESWRVARVRRDGVPSLNAGDFALGDATLLDAWSPTALGGTGHSFDWGRVAGSVADLRRNRRMILAGGLTPANVREAIERLDPDAVDVSSGVEISPGVKDHGMMKAFVEAATAAKKGTE